MAMFIRLEEHTLRPILVEVKVLLRIASRLVALNRADGDESQYM